MELITIGVIVNTHGLRGTLKVKSFTDFKNERYQKGTTLYIAFKQELIPVTVKQYRTIKNLDYIDFNEFNNINLVEKFKGCDIKFDKELAHELSEDEFYFDELIGLEVYTDQLIGNVVGVREVPQGELLEIETKDKKVILVPFRKQFIDEVDHLNNRIKLIMWEGLL